MTHHGLWLISTDRRFSMALSEKERNALLSARLRNLQRKYDKVIKQTNEMNDELIELKTAIDSTKDMLN